MNDSRKYDESQKSKGSSGCKSISDSSATRKLKLSQLGFNKGDKPLGEISEISDEQIQNKQIFEFSNSALDKSEYFNNPQSVKSKHFSNSIENLKRYDSLKMKDRNSVVMQPVMPDSQSILPEISNNYLLSNACIKRGAVKQAHFKSLEVKPKQQIVSFRKTIKFNYNANTETDSNIALIKAPEDNIIKLKQGFMKIKTREISYSVSSTAEKVDNLPLNKLTVRGKFRRAYLKLKVVLLFNYIWSRMKFYGLNVLKGDIQDELKNFEINKIRIIQKEKKQKIKLDLRFYFHPHSIFFDYWNAVRIILHFYSMTFMIYFLCAYESFVVLGRAWLIDYAIEFLFFIDMILHFFTAYFEGSQLVNSNLMIAKNYITGWFFFDFISIFPFEACISNSKFNLVLLTHPLILHRAARVFNNVRIRKYFRHYERRGTIKKLSQNAIVDQIFKKFSMSAGLSRLFNTLMLVLILSHLFACLWYYTARLDKFNEDTWMSRYNMLDADPSKIYLASVYYILTTITSCGFGDIYSVTIKERILTCIWMVVGVAFYSYVISNLSSIISSMDFQSSVLQTKLEGLRKVSDELRIPDNIYLKVKMVYEDNDKQCFMQDDNNLFEDLPYNIKVEILYHIHYDKIVNNVYLLDRNPNLVVEILILWKAIIFSSCELVYIEDEIPSDSKDLSL